MSSPYKEFLMDHAHHPRRSQPLPRATLSSSATDSICGDQVDVTLQINEGIIRDVGIVVEGCALATAGGSVLSEWLIGTRVDDARSIDHQLIESLLHIESPLPSRVRCMVLASDTVKRMLANT